MDTGFLNYLLLFILLLILIIYLLQTTRNTNTNTNNTNNATTTTFHTSNNKMKNININNIYEDNFLINNHIKNTPFHIRGPVKCFHQQFNIKNNSCVSLL